MHRKQRPLFSLLLTFAIAGCGGDAADTGTTGARSTETIVNQTAASAPQSNVPPTASISADQAEPDEQPGGKRTAAIADDGAKGTPQWLLREVVRLSQVAAAAKSEGKAEIFRRSHEKIVELATETIAKTHAEPDQETLFNTAVRYLASARVELALAGDEESAHLLAQDAESLYQRDRQLGKTSVAAAEAAHKLMQLAQKMAQRQGADAPQWSAEFARQARLFAEKFPHEESRAAVMLIAAGRQCEAVGRLDAARDCFRTVTDKYPGSAFADQIAGIQRRLNLENTQLDFAGPTIDGGWIDIQQYAGKPVLIVFWASNSRTFAEVLPRIVELEAKFGERLQIVGVNLDRQEPAVDAFLTQAGITWPQVFYSDPTKRGGRNPVARYYGVTSVPTLWLVDATGIVVRAPVNAESVIDEVTSLLN